MFFCKKYRIAFSCWLLLSTSALLAGEVKQLSRSLPNTKVLTLEKPLDEVMVSGIDRFALKEIEKARIDRKNLWDKIVRQEKEIRKKSLNDLRALLSKNIGAVDSREPTPRIQVFADLNEKVESTVIRNFRCQVFQGVSAEGLFCSVTKFPKARVILLLDPEWSAEDLFSTPCDEKIKSTRQLVLELLNSKCDVYIPTLINRDVKYSGHPEAYKTNIPHREWIYRMSFSVGRHIVGYEVQKVMSLCDAFEQMTTRSNVPIGVAGIGEGGQIALLAAAIDTRIESVLVSGYFDRRESVWEEPIYRNLWSQLSQFGDAEIAALVAPRNLIVEASSSFELVDTPTFKGLRNTAAPGKISSPKLESVKQEYERAYEYYSAMNSKDSIQLVSMEVRKMHPCSEKSRKKFLKSLGLDSKVELNQKIGIATDNSTLRQKRQFYELVEFTQKLVRSSAKRRDKLWRKVDRSSVTSWEKSAAELRSQFYDQVIGRIEQPPLSFNARSRMIMDEEKFHAYELILDVFPDVIAGGVLLLPKGMKPNEKRPVVVCQHGLEGTPMSTISDEKRAYKAFSRKLVERGFIVYAPQNPYRGKDRFRTLQRKSNPLGRSLYSYIIPQHQQTLRWLATLSNVDEKRIAFYGLSYGGKTAVRVPTMFVQGPDQPAYCLSICSGDFNEWVLKLTSTSHRTSYMFHGEHEIWEWDLANVANYAELATLMTPRPFMVERGHRDGVAHDEWVAWEYAKVRRHYDELGIGDRTEIEFFVGGHEINEKKTYDFLHRHLNWPKSN